MNVLMFVFDRHPGGLLVALLNACETSQADLPAIAIDRTADEADEASWPVAALDTKREPPTKHEVPAQEDLVVPETLPQQEVAFLFEEIGDQDLSGAARLKAGLDQAGGVVFEIRLAVER